MKRVEVPGGDGWFDLNELSGLTSDHQEEYLDLADELRADKREALAAAEAAKNPAVMPGPVEDIPVRLTRKDLGPINALVEGWMVAGSSFGMPLPKPMPLMAANVLANALEPVFSALNGSVPKENPGSDSTSTST